MQYWFETKQINALLTVRQKYAENGFAIVIGNIPRGGGVLLGIFGGAVPPASPNPDPISEQKIPFFTPVFRPDLALD